MKRIIAKAAAIIIVFSLLPVSGAYAAVDTNASSWAADSVISAHEAGLVSSGLVMKCRNNITRSEFAGMVMNLYRKITGETGRTENPSRFTDDSSNDSFMAVELGIMDAIDDITFAPDALVMREDLAQYLLNLLKACDFAPNITAEMSLNFTDKSDIGSDCRDAVTFMQHYGVLQGYDGYFYPTAYVTVEQAIVTALKLYEFFTVKEVVVSGKNITLGDSAESVLNKFGEPLRIDINEYGCERYIYKDADKGILMIGVLDGKVKDIFTNYENFNFLGITPKTAPADFDINLGAELVYKSEMDYYSYSATIYFVYDDKFYADGIYLKDSSLKPVLVEDTRINDSAQTEFFELINIMRAKKSLEPLQLSLSAQSVAQAQSGHIGNSGKAKYYDARGNGPFERLRMAGAEFTRASECVSDIPGGVAEVFYNWMGTDGYRANILSSSYKYIGTGAFLKGSSLYITTDFYC